MTADIQKRVAAGRRKNVVAVVVAALIFAFIITMALVQAFGRVDPVSARVDEGTTVDLARRAEVTARSFTVTPAADNTSTVVVNVSFCGGDRISKNGVDAAVHQNVRPDDFTLHDAAAVQGQLITDNTNDLRAATLRVGQCVEGDLRYTMNGPSTGLRLSYRNGLGDDIVWYDR